MTANTTKLSAPKGAMPEMPEAALLTHRGTEGWTREQVEADRLACFLAGLEAARACVPGPSSMSTHGTLAACSGWNSACDQTLANLKALEEGVAKGPALERTASGANFPKKEEAKK